jgi:23S rRNA (guanosine2251-2'-O)-methyltransferase
VILFGRNIFKEALAARASILECYVETKSAYEWLRKQSGTQFDSLKVQEGIPASLQKENHQGIAFQTNHAFYKTYDAQEMRKYRSIVLCNHVEDVHNLGSITRCAAAFGSSLIIHEEDRSASMTAAVVKSSAGCAFRVSFMKVDSLETPLKTLKKSDYEIFGLDVSDPSQELYEANLTPRAPRAFVFGSEGFGIEDVNKSYCKSLLKIPMASSVESLNVSHAAAVVLSWAYRLDQAGA